MNVYRLVSGTADCDALESLGAGKLEERGWTGNRASQPQRLPFAPQIGKRGHDVHGPKTPRGASARGQVCRSSESLGAESGGNTRLQPLGEGGTDQTTEYVAAAAGGEPRVSRDNGHERPSA